MRVREDRVMDWVPMAQGGTKIDAWVLEMAVMVVLTPQRVTKAVEGVRGKPVPVRRS